MKTYCLFFVGFLRCKIISLVVRVARVAWFVLGGRGIEGWLVHVCGGLIMMPTRQAVDEFAVPPSEISR